MVLVPWMVDPSARVKVEGKESEGLTVVFDSRDGKEEVRRLRMRSLGEMWRVGGEPEAGWGTGVGADDILRGVDIDDSLLLLW